jgi:Cation efflux family
MAKALSSKTIVWFDLAADVVVAAVKIAASLFTGSASMAASSVQSMVDVGRGGMLLYEYRSSQRGPDRRHPLDHGRELYFWSFVVALLFFTLGAGFSTYEGVQRIMNPMIVRSPLVIYLVLGVNARFDAASWIVPLKEVPGGQGRPRVLAGDQVEQGPAGLHRPYGGHGRAGRHCGRGGRNLHCDSPQSPRRGRRRLGADWFDPRRRRLGPGKGKQGPADRRTGGKRPFIIDHRPLREPERNRGRERRGRDPSRARSGGCGAQPRICRRVGMPDIEEAVQELEARIREKHSEVVALFVKPQRRQNETPSLRAK